MQHDLSFCARSCKQPRLNPFQPDQGEVYKAVTSIVYAASVKLAYTPQPMPSQIKAFKDSSIRAFSCGHNHVVALDTEKQAWSWGLHLTSSRSFSTKHLQHFPLSSCASVAAYSSLASCLVLSRLHSSTAVWVSQRSWNCRTQDVLSQAGDVV